MVAFRLCDRLIGLASLAILARLLAPEDFGLFALAMAVVAIVEVFGHIGSDLALIRDRRTDRALYDSAWTLNLALGFSFMLALVAIAEPVAAFYADPRVATLFYWLALAALITGFENVGIVDFRKDLAFGREFKFLFSVRLIGAIATVIAAAFLGDWRALLIGTLTSRTARLGLSYAMHAFRPRLSVREFRALVNFSVWVLLQSMMSTLTRRLAPLLIGRYADAGAVAFYTVAEEISSLATTELIAPIRRALFPVFARMDAERSRLANAVIESFGVMALIGLPLAAGIALIAAEAVRIVLGPQWAAVVPLIEILAFAGVLQTLGTGSHLAYLAIGRPRITAWLEALKFGLTAPFLVVGLHVGGIVGAAWATVAAAVIFRVVDYAVIVRIMEIRWREIAIGLLRPLLAAGLMIAAVTLARDNLPTSTTIAWSFARLVLLSAVGAMSYAATVLALWWLVGRPQGAESRILEFVRLPFARSREEGAA